MVKPSGRPVDFHFPSGETLGVETRTRPRAFQFTDPVSFLRAVYQDKKNNNGRFSVSQWAVQLGLNNPTTVWRILSGKRNLGLAMGKHLSEKLKLEPDEKRYFIILVLSQQLGVTPKTLLRALSPVSANLPKTRIREDKFRLISDWYHLTILEMLGLEGFRADPNWISRRLGGKVAPGDCAKALARLQRLGLVETLRSGQMKRSSSENIETESEIPSAAIREFHRQMIQMAGSAIDAQDLETRRLDGSTIAIHKDDLGKAKAIILKAHNRLAKLCRDSGANEVFHFSTQFFRLTAPIPDRNEPKDFR